MKIKVDVNNVTIIEKSDIHKGEYNVNKCIFEFSSEYTKDLIYRAVFSCINGSYYQLILNNECNIPEEILKEKDVNIELGVYAYILNDDNELELRYSPKPTCFRVENGSYKDADKTEVPSPTDYEKFLNEFNRNANEKAENFNKNYEDKIKAYNDNSIQKTNEYNKNADEKIKEINNKVLDVEKIEDNIEEIEKNVQVSEQKVKDSEISAQNSAKKASESESNIISIEKNINGLKKDIDNTKTQIDEKAKEVKDNSDIAIEQARIATQQATLSGQNANKTSVDKEDISQMKVSIEASEDNIEEIEKNVQAIKDDIEAAKNETLEAKEEVENSLENERIENDKKYARAIDSDVINVDNFGQIECDDDDYMKDVEIESTLLEITQDTREGYNHLELTLETQSIGGLDITVNSDKSITLNGTTTNNVAIFISDFKNMQAGKFTSVINSNQVLKDKDYYIDYRDSNSVIYGTTKFSNILKVFELSEPKAIRAFLWIGRGITLENLTIKPMLVEGEYTEDNLPTYEEYGASPSLDYPSEFKNTLSSFNIKNTVDEVEKYDKQISLPENKFLGTFNSYKNYIKDNKLKSNLKIVEFTEILDWTYHEPENKFMCSIPSNAKIKDISLTQLCSHYKTKSDFASNENEFACTANGFRFHNDNNMTLEEWKTFLAQQKEAGTPLQILYISNEEEIELEDINLPLYKSINNISAEDLKMSFKQNMKAIAEKTANNRYARALKTKVEDVEQTQIYAENDEVEDLTIKGAPLTQKTREGYNEIQNEVETSSMGGIDITRNSDGSVTLNGTATENIRLFYSTKSITLNGKYIFYLIGKNNQINLQGIEDGSILAYLAYAFPYNYIERSYEADTVLSSLFSYIAIGKTFNNETYYPMITKGEEVKPYEEYGASPSLDFPSEIQIASEQNITINETNITIPLVNSAIGQYADTIDRKNNLQNKVIQELTLTGDEDYYYSGVYNNIYQYNLNISNPSLSNDDFIVRAKSNYFKGIGRKNSWLYDNTVTTETKEIRFMTSQYATVEDFKTKIKELYNAGTPVKVYYVAKTSKQEPLSEEVKQELDKFKLYDGLNNVSIDNGTLSFKYNKSLSKVLEEKDEIIDNLLTRVQALEQAQVNQVGGN